MVELDQGADGVVTLRFLPPYGDNDERAYLDALGLVGRLDRRYALLTVFGGGGKLSAAGEREQALWFKATRDQMNRCCAGIAMIRPGATEATAAVFQRLWPFPVSLVSDEAAGRAVLRAHLGAIS
ncbi:hypothetical protein [Phreatobacter stygius]|uniref:Uncharacterized protein n=1 Tax=Phreatobacter stygius TaxID=1940610 RepID=A0A4D7B9R7_9HYPH|nr:hypothetical protein [Phreatobacter stygius]QCI64782.1 hypothetical protein E8M01_11440 [Phreatobacter stygius]